MKRSRCWFVHQLTFAVSLVVLSSPLEAQAPPRPAVEIRQMPELWQSVWPADFNRDGRTDLVASQRQGSAAFGPIVVRIGNGDGTFGAARNSGRIGIPVATADFNGDRRIDVVAIGEGDAMFILPGRGDGTFDPPRPLDPVADFRFALAGDFDDDGFRDLVIGYGDTVEMHPGLGDFTFGPRATLPAGNGYGVNAAIAADFNGDGRPDLAVAQLFGSVFVYMNRGGLLFDAAEIFIANDEMYGITAWDLDRDGDQDLIVPHTFMGGFDWNTGGVDVLLGNGDGSFAPAVRYHTGLDGPFTAVAGHFNGDAHVDIAVGSRSWTYVDAGYTRHYWDSVSIFPGRGDGTLAPAVRFRLDTRPYGATPECWALSSSCYVETHHALKTSDLDADGRTDLIASPGALLLTRPVAANRPPAVDAGPDITVSPYTSDAPLVPTISEPDWEWLSVEWRDETGAVIARVPSFVYQIATRESRTLTITVTDARGGTASDSVTVTRQAAGSNPPDVRVERPSDEVVPAGEPYTIRWRAADDTGIAEFDVFVAFNERTNWTAITECTNLRGDLRSCVWRNPGPVHEQAFVRVVATDLEGQQGAGESPSSFSIRENPTGPGGLPFGWACASIGAVGAQGSCSHADGVFTVRGSGADIWGTADEFQAALHRLVTGDFALTARVVSVENVHRWTKVGLMIRDGSSPGGRHASFFVTPTREKSTAFQRRPTRDGSSVHTPGPLATAPIWVRLVRTGDVISAYSRRTTTDPWEITGRQTFTSLPEQMVPMLVVSSHVDGTLATGRFDNVTVDEVEPMTSADVGATRPGHTESDSTIATIHGNGADIWGTADAFRYHYARWSGDGTITVRVLSLERTHDWAKAGVMFRESLAPGSKHAMAIVSAGRGVALQYRSATGGASGAVPAVSGAAPRWVRLTRSGNTFRGYTSSDGVTFTPIGSITITMPSDILVGLAVTSHTASTTAEAEFDDWAIRP